MGAKKGFAAMDPELRREIARKGGKRAHETGRAHEFTTEEARAAGVKGGRAVSREDQIRAGRLGGLEASRRRREKKAAATTASSDGAGS